MSEDNKDQKAPEKEKNSGPAVQAQSAHKSSEAQSAPAPAQSVEAAELERLTLEEKRLSVQFQKAQLEDMRERLDERGLKREVARSRSITNGATLKQLATNDEIQQNRCNHHKGGNGLNGYVGGQGDDPQYAVIKHKMSNSDLWVRCMRCGKTWKPPIAADYKTAEEFAKRQAEYQQAVNFPTRNVTSSSIVFQFSDGGAQFRQENSQVSLR